MHQPAVQYASSVARERFPLADFLTFFAIAAFTVGVLALPILYIDRFRKVYDDFKLKLPGSTQLMIDVYTVLDGVYARYWIWIIPVLLPLWLVRLPKDARLRIAVLMLLMAGSAVVWFVIAMIAPMFTLIEGMTSH